MPQAAIFDLDGTLVDTAPGLRLAVNLMLADYGKPALPLDMVKSFIGRGIPALVRDCLRARGLPENVNEEALRVFNAHYLRDPAFDSLPYPGVLDCLRLLRAQGWRLGVCTNKATVPARRILSDVGLHEFFPEIVCGDTLSVRKPDPSTLLQVIRSLGVAVQQAVFVGDGEIDCETAGRAGCRFVFFAGGYGSAGGLPTPCQSSFEGYLHFPFSANGG